MMDMLLAEVIAAYHRSDEKHLAELKRLLAAEIEYLHQHGRERSPGEIDELRDAVRFVSAELRGDAVQQNIEDWDRLARRADIEEAAR